MVWSVASMILSSTNIQGELAKTRCLVAPYLCLRRGQTAVVKDVPVSISARDRDLSLAVKGAKMFNLLPRYLRDFKSDQVQSRDIACCIVPPGSFSLAIIRSSK